VRWFLRCVWALHGGRLCAAQVLLFAAQKFRKFLGERRRSAVG
jgi:hypothetical protein